MCICLEACVEWYVYRGDEVRTGVTVCVYDMPDAFKGGTVSEGVIRCVEKYRYALNEEIKEDEHVMEECIRATRCGYVRQINGKG